MEQTASSTISMPLFRLMPKRRAPAWYMRDQPVEIADAAGGFDLDPLADDALHQLHILQGGAALGPTGAGLDERRARSAGRCGRPV